MPITVDLNPDLKFQVTGGSGLVRPARLSFYHDPESDKYQPDLETQPSSWSQFESNYSADPDRECIQMDQANNFIRTYWECFHRHGTAVFSPSDLWLVISLSFSKYAAEHPQTMKRFISPYLSDKKLLTLRVDPIKGPRRSWSTSIDQMTERIRDSCWTPELVSILKNDLDCALPVERTACNVAVMKATEKFYTYRFMALCGFRAVKILGDKQDWTQLREKIVSLAEWDWDGITNQISTISGSEPQKVEHDYLTVYDRPDTSRASRGTPLVPRQDATAIQTGVPGMLWSSYTKELLEIVDKFIDALDEKPDKKFFKEIVHNETALGFYQDSADTISGWILKLFYGFSDSYIVSEVPILEAQVSAFYQPDPHAATDKVLESDRPITIYSGFYGHQIQHDSESGHHEYRPITYWGIKGDLSPP